ncbi:uncharacterized protein CDAR_173801 [Caerostris darwini]|uniref:Uncharacterized protein n=1 Tax=Caerostris darwini TaxID=1538125 RepID=A0AAV4VFW0_9ARAC|nr:uncharacterized protein CDAR_173801 [Caerostris darwini]
MYFTKFFSLTILFIALLSEGTAHPSSIFSRIQVRSHGCGKNPLLQILDESTADSDITPEQVLKILDETEDIREEVLNMLRLYDDCIRTADGIKYRKSPKLELSEAYSEFYKKVIDAL